MGSAPGSGAVSGGPPETPHSAHALRAPSSQQINFRFPLFPSLLPAPCYPLPLSTFNFPLFLLRPLLAKLMIHFDIGVTPGPTYQIKTLDHAFFTPA